MGKLDGNLSMLSEGLNRNRRKLAGRSPEAFAKIYMASNCSAPFSRMHKEMFASLLDMIEHRRANLAIAAPRGHAKSTIVSLVYVLWCALYLKEKLILIASNTETQAITLLKDIKSQLKDNPLLVSDFPEICQGKKPRPWRDNRIQLPNGVMICAYGAGQSLRGIKNDKDRPGLIIADDLENEEQAQSEEQREKLHSWFNRTLLNAGHPQTNVVVVGTILHHNSLLANLVDRNRSPGWNGKIYKAIENFSDKPQLWEKWSSIYRSLEDYEGATGPTAAKSFFDARSNEMLEGTSVLWPQWETYYALMEQRENQGVRSFQSEKQNEPIDPQQCIFKEETFQYWDDKFKDVQHLITAIGDRGLFYGACDPSLGRTTISDYTAILVLLQDKDSKVNYVIAADLLHCSPTDTLNRIVEYIRMYKFEYFAIEVNNFQQLMADELKERINLIRHSTSIFEIKSVSNKRSRIAGMEPYITQGRLRFCRQHRQLLEQLIHFPLAKNDDGPDALEMALEASKEERAVWRWHSM